MVARLSESASWEFAAKISPRPHARVGVAGDENLFPRQRLIAGVAPKAPWAVYLTDTDGAYWLAGFDFDAHTPSAAAQADRDAVFLEELCGFAGIPVVVCQSGPGGGRHVWLGFCEAVPAAVIAGLALDLKALLPSLDNGLLMNPQTGCLRPPGAPHREGGRSEVLRGDLEVLTAPTVRAADVGGLAATVRELARVSGAQTDIPKARPSARPRRVKVRRRERRDLPRFAVDALNTPVKADEDASVVLWRILIGAAWAGWSFEDVWELVDEPGMERVRTVRAGRGRRRRPHAGPQSPRRVLQADWERALVHVESRPKQLREGISTAAADTAVRVDRVQRRADASAGRWGRGAGPSDRRILDVLCMFALQAATPVVEADIRRLGMTAGISRETARTALLRLAEEGWIRQVRPAAGARGAVWEVAAEYPTEVIHNDAVDSRSQLIVTPPAPAETLFRYWIDTLTTRTATSAHDVFTAAGCGILAGNVLARLSEATRGVPIGVDLPLVEGTLVQLASVGLAWRKNDAWEAASEPVRASVARFMGAAGVLQARREQYERERIAWAWWLQEAAWMGATGRSNPVRATPRSAEGTRFPAHPRRADGRASFTLAAQLVREGVVAAA